MPNSKARPDRRKIVATDLAPARGRLVFDPSQCRTCKVCEVTCSIVKEGQARPSLARMNVYFDEFSFEDPITGVVCAQCSDAPCAEACPVAAIERDAATGALIIDDDLCIGCMRCATACPWDVPKKHPEREIALKCDLCLGRPLGPACVQACPLTGKALRYEPDYYLSNQER